MKFLKHTLPIWALLALLAFAVIQEPTLAEASSQTTTSILAVGVAVAAAPVSVNAVEAPVPVEPEGTGKLAGYVLTAMLEWTSKRDSAPITHLAEIARAIAWVALEEPRVWDGSDGAREAILLARIAWFESRFRDYVWEYKCNDSAWRATKIGRELLTLGNCDGSYAFSIHQIHMECGSIAILPDGTWQNACSPMRPARLVVKTKDLLDDQKLGIRVALAMARTSIRVGAGLRNFVGGDGPERAGMAAQRLDSAMAYSRKHPYVPAP